MVVMALLLGVRGVTRRAAPEIVDVLEDGESLVSRVANGRATRGLVGARRCGSCGAGSTAASLVEVRLVMMPRL